MSFLLEAGQELYTSYGSHSNDFLLAECKQPASPGQEPFLTSRSDGFILENNAHDSIPLDDSILHHLTDSVTRDTLERCNYLGNYTLYPAPRGPCHRTAVSIRTQTLSAEDWDLFVLGETPSIGETRDEQLATHYLVEKVLRPYLEEVEGILQQFEDDGMREGLGVSEHVWDILKRRWVQMKVILEGALNHLGQY